MGCAKAAVTRDRASASIRRAHGGFAAFAHPTTDELSSHRPHFRRRDLIRTLGLAAPAVLIGRAAGAASFPEKDIAFIIPYSAGGGFDTYVRALQPALERSLPNKVNVVPTNIAAGGGSRGIAQLYRSRPDGYTIGIFNIPGMFILQEEQGRGAGYDIGRFVWLGGIGRDRYGLGVGANSPLKSIADLKKLSATRPVKFTSTGPEGTAYSATLIATKLLGINAQLITGYKGSIDYVLGAIRGDGDAVITALPVLRRMERGKTLRLLAVFEETSADPGVDTAASLGAPELASITLDRLIGAPPGTPNEVRDVLAAALGQAVADPQVVAWAKSADAELAWSSPAKAAQILADQQQFFAKWKQVIVK